MRILHQTILLVLLIPVFSCKQETKKTISQKENQQILIVKKSSSPITIDGIGNETIWQKSNWFPINQVWLGKPIDSTDFSGRYKLSWSNESLYVLAEVTDDTLVNKFKNPLERWWDEDCVEIFIDEDNSGGDHQFNHNAFAYHIDLDGNVVDIIAKDTPKLFNDHMISARKTKENLSTWEFKINLYPDTFKYGNKVEPIELFKGKKIGFAIAYCDNDTSEHRENFIGSVHVKGDDKDRGWKDANIFGTLELQ